MGIQAINGGLSFDSTKMAQAMFKKFDSNSDDGIDKTEFKPALPKNNGAVQDIDKIFSKIDINGDNKIDQSEHENILKKMSKQHPGGMHGGPKPSGGAKPSGKAQQAVSSANASQSNDIKIYDKMDMDKDGTVSYQEELEYELNNPEIKSTKHLNIFA